MVTYSVPPYPGPFPRGRHSHRCRACGEGSTCYKAKCIHPQKLDLCEYCCYKRSHGETIANMRDYSRR